MEPLTIIKILAGIVFIGFVYRFIFMDQKVNFGKIKMFSEIDVSVKGLFEKKELQKAVELSFYKKTNNFWGDKYIKCGGIRFYGQLEGGEEVCMIGFFYVNENGEEIKGLSNPEAEYQPIKVGSKLTYNVTYDSENVLRVFIRVADEKYKIVEEKICNSEYFSVDLLNKKYAKVEL